MRFVELSHVITHEMVTYPGLPGPSVCDFLSREASRGRYAEGTSFHIGRVDMVANTGTYVDAPFHRYEDGVDVAGLALERLAHLPAVVVRAATAGRRLGPELFDDVPTDGVAVLVDTGWSARFGTPEYGVGHPYLTEEAAARLVERRVAFVGIDSLNIDDVERLDRPVHTALLGAGIPIGEHLTGLHHVPDLGARFTAVPAPVRGLGSFPVRAFAMLAE